MKGFHQFLEDAISMSEFPHLKFSHEGKQDEQPKCDTTCSFRHTLAFNGIQLYPEIDVRIAPLPISQCCRGGFISLSPIYFTFANCPAVSVHFKAEHMNKFNWLRCLAVTKKTTANGIAGARGRHKNNVARYVSIRCSAEFKSPT